MVVEQTLVLIKPDGIQRGLTGRILSRFEDAGLKFIGMKMVWLNKDFSKKHYSAHTKKEFYKGLEKMITSGPILALCIEGVHAVQIVRKMAGGTEPKSAQPGTIRGDFALHSYEYADKKGIAIKNLIHASENSKEAKTEVKLWFSAAELHAYKTVHEKHVF